MTQGLSRSTERRRGSSVAFALAAPGITIVLLAVLVGVFLVMYGFFSFIAGFSLLDLREELRRSERRRAPEESRQRMRAA